VVFLEENSALKSIPAFPAFWRTVIKNEEEKTGNSLSGQNQKLSSSLNVIFTSGW
jgi:hypothetical protein